MYNYYLAILLISLAFFILYRGVLACMFNHISELKGYYGLTEWFLVVFSWNLRSFVCLDVAL